MCVVLFVDVVNNFIAHEVAAIQEQLKEAERQKLEEEKERKKVENEFEEYKRERRKLDAEFEETNK